MINLLTTKDLNDFKLALNKYNDVLTVKSKHMLVLKSKFAAGDITEDKVKEAEAEYNKIKDEFTAFSKDQKFKVNYENAKQHMKTFKKGSKEYWDFYKQFTLSIYLYKESKIAIRERGKTAKLSKLNDISLKLNNVKFKYREEHPYAVNDVSVEINHGEYVAVIGHNGSGKSTLSKIIIGVLAPTNGGYSVFGNNVSLNNITLIRKFLGIVFQNPDNQFIGSTVRDDIAFGLENRRIAPSKMNKIIVNAATKVGMEEFLDHEPLMLSGGQKQRVAIASALALSPDIIIFDEATSMLDPKGKNDIKNIMVELKNTREKTIISITHDMDEILNADKVMVMNAGKLVKFGTPKDVMGDKEFLRSIHLDIPFLGQVEEELEKVGIKLTASANMEELVEKIMQKIKLSPEQKAEKKVNKKQENFEYKEALKELDEKIKSDKVKRKKRHKEILTMIKADRKNQKVYLEEIKKYKTEDKLLISKRLEEVEKWYESQDKNQKDVRSLYKYKISKAKRTNFDYSGDIVFENASYTYGINTPFEFRALDGTELTIEKGKITAVIGMTGSGKSTLIQLTNGLIMSETGRVWIGNYQLPAKMKKINEVKDLRREIGLVFQFPEYQLFQDSIEKDIAFGPINLGELKSTSIKKVPELLNLVDLPADYLKRSPFDLSGGQKRRVAIAGIIALDGNTLVLDEPTGGLDPQGEEDFMKLFYKLNKVNKKRIIIVTHNMDHVLKIADQVVVMHKGKVIKKDTPFKIFSDKELLEKIEIEPPKLYKLAFMLKDKGIDVTDSEFRNVSEFAKYVKEKRK